MEPVTPKEIVCVKNDGYPVALEVGRPYAVLPDPDAEAKGFVRVVDESGEDYLYPAGYFESAEETLKQIGK